MLFKRLILLSLLAFSIGSFIFSLKPNGPTPVPAPTPEEVFPPITHYNPPTINPAPAYTIIFVGDSMTDALGPNFDALRPILQLDFPDKVFGLFNYGFSSTNILSVDDRLHHDSDYLGTELPAILSRDFDIIIIESMGHNPLSEYPLDEGLQKQTSALDTLVSQLVYFKPSSLIVFLATIAPSQAHYAEKSVDLSPEKRIEWANERRAYIENHINYAQSHNIPLIDVYHQSLKSDGTANLQYINRDDYIHPSTAGIKLISQSIATYLDSVLPR